MTFGVTGGGLLPSDVEKERRVQYGEKDGKLGEWLTTCANRMTDGTRARGSNARTRTHVDGTGTSMSMGVATPASQQSFSAGMCANFIHMPTSMMYGRWCGPFHGESS